MGVVHPSYTDRDRHSGCRDHQRLARVMLDPLAEIGIGVVVPILIGRRQGVVNFERAGKRRHAEQQQGHQHGNRTASAANGRQQAWHT